MTVLYLVCDQANIDPSTHFNPAKGSMAYAPGDYTVGASEPKVVDGRLVMYPDLVLLKSAAKAA